MHIIIKTIIVNLVLFAATCEPSEPKNIPQSPCLKPAVPTDMLEPFFLTGEDELLDLFGDRFSLTDPNDAWTSEIKFLGEKGVVEKSKSTALDHKAKKRHKKSKVEEKNNNNVRATKSTLFSVMKSSRLKKRKN
jgi:hypothetical protein